MVSIIGRLATEVKNRNVREINSIVKNNTSSQIIVLHFIKRDYDLPFHVKTDSMDTPLIEFAKKARSTNEHFLPFKLLVVII